MEYATVASAATPIESRATPRSPNPGGAKVPISPFWPPVSPRHSTAACSTMKPKAMVTMARYGPFTRTAGSASSAPVSVATTAATGSAAQKLHFAAARIATV
jgi:hypothetical protein